MSVNSNNPAYVFDSFALLAYLNGETGRERVVEILTRSLAGEMRTLLCSINLGEILDTLERRRGLVQAQRAQALIESLPIIEADATRTLVLEAAHIKALHPISYANAFVAALALREDAIILTGDPEFKSVQSLVRVEWLTPTMG